MEVCASGRLLGERYRFECRRQLPFTIRQRLGGRDKQLQALMSWLRIGHRRH